MYAREMLVVKDWGGRGKYSTPCPVFLLQTPDQHGLSGEKAENPWGRSPHSSGLMRRRLFGSEAGVATDFEFHELLFCFYISRRQ
jgi:hypothetical protein